MPRQGKAQECWTKPTELFSKFFRCGLKEETKRNSFYSLFSREHLREEPRVYPRGGSSSSWQTLESSNVCLKRLRVEHTRNRLVYAIQVLMFLLLKMYHFYLDILTTALSLSVCLFEIVILLESTGVLFFSISNWESRWFSRLGLISTLNPLRKRSFSKTLFKPKEFENNGFSFRVNGKHFENDDLTIMIWSPCRWVFSPHKSKWPGIVTFLNWSSVLWMECVMRPRECNQTRQGMGACTKTRNNETKLAKRNPRSHRNERNETTETNETKPPKQAKRNHRNKRNDQNEIPDTTNTIRNATKRTSPWSIERQNYLTFRTLSSKAVL